MKCQKDNLQKNRKRINSRSGNSGKQCMKNKLWKI